MKRLRFLSLVAVVALVLVSALLMSQARDVGAQSKFLGNIWRTGTEPLNFSLYWNQVSPENSGKWTSCEPTRDVMETWLWLDRAYDYAKSHGMPFKEHTLVWGHSSGEPSWVCSLSEAEQRAEVEEWIQAVCQRYPDMDYIDVVNEPLHDPPCYANALGGSGSTGWDWVIWSFETARQYCGDADLLLNEYNIINNEESSALERFIDVVEVLQSRGLVDGIGVQGHSMENTPASDVLSKLNRLDDLGLPIYVSELELRGDDSLQLQLYQNLFPVMWEHDAVHGITLWGYVQGEMWRDEAHLLKSDGTERPAMTWLMDYVGGVQPTTVPTSTPVTVVPPTPTTPPGGVYQAEDASLGGGVSVDTNHSGYYGSGFVNFPSSGGYVEYRSVDGGNGGSRTLRFRHALGATGARTGQLTINGASRNITFQPTGSWDSWAILEVTVNLNAGTSNTIRLQSTGQDLANQDQMEVVGGTSPTATPVTVVPPTSTPVTVAPPTSTPVTVVPPTSTPDVPGGCAVNYVIQNDWGSGATVNVTVQNNGGSAINGWTLTWAFPGNQQIVHLWNGSYTQSGASVSVSNAAWNGTIGGSGGTVSFGFNLSYSGTNAEPASFSLNGTVCQ
ncbi:MAG: endo-1,4-beta-xylanase [Anaerolineae bacterium]|nr:endo-1,4-beta-xylanase [Anaerolineae bacterium]